MFRCVAGSGSQEVGGPVILPRYVDITTLDIYRRVGSFVLTDLGRLHNEVRRRRSAGITDGSSRRAEITDCQFDLTIGCQSCSTKPVVARVQTTACRVDRQEVLVEKIARAAGRDNERPFAGNGCRRATASGCASIHGDIRLAGSAIKVQAANVEVSRMACTTG